MNLSADQLAILNTLRDAVSANAHAKGFKLPPPGVSVEVWESPAWDYVRAAIFTANQHGETSEFWEAARVGTLKKPCDKAEKMAALDLPELTCAAEEIADEIIRALDKAAEFGVDVAEAIATKMAFNAQRAYLHGNKLALGPTLRNAHNADDSRTRDVRRPGRYAGRSEERPRTDPLRRRR